VFATFNSGKVMEVAGILDGLPIEVVGPREVGVDSLPDETGDTFIDNAMIKAAHVFNETGIPTFADDSGLEVMSLSGDPGVHSARYAGTEHDDRANIDRLLSELRGIEDRRARFVCTIACIIDGGEVLKATLNHLPDGVSEVRDHPAVPPGAAVFTSKGETWGRIIDTPAGHNGFGYDPVFFRDDLGCTFAQISRDEKSALSHRGQAFRRLRRFLETTIAR